MKPPVLIVSSEFPPQPGGIGHHALNLARGLHGAGYLTKVLTNSRGHDLEQEAAFDSQQSFQVHRIKRYRVVFATYWRRIAAFLSLLAKAPNTKVVVSGKYSLWLGLLGKWIFPRHLYIGVVHGTEIIQGGDTSKWLTKSSLCALDKLVAVSRFTRDLLQKQGVNRPIDVVNNGFDPEKMRVAYAVPHLLSSAPALITVGSISPRKGQHHVIEALPKLGKRFPGIVYHVVGMALPHYHLEPLIEAKGLQHQVKIHGMLSDQALQRLLTASDIFIMLSTQTASGDVEGFGIAILEANALGLPAIGARGCGIEDAIRDGFSGRLVDAHSPVDIQNALEDIILHFESYSNNAKTWASRFTWDKKIAEYLRVIE